MAQQNSPIPNYESILESQAPNKENILFKYFPKNPKILLFGASSSGKTNWLLHLVFSPQNDGGLYLKPTIYLVCSSTLDQLKYRLLQHVTNKNCAVRLFQFSSLQDFIKFCSDKKASGQSIVSGCRDSIVIFDDLPLDNTEESAFLRHFLSVSRHFNITLMALFQCYSRTSKFIRENADVAIVFSTDQLALSLIHRDFCFSDHNFEQFAKLARVAWSQKYRPLVINRRPLTVGEKFRAGLKEFLT